MTAFVEAMAPAARSSEGLTGAPRRLRPVINTVSGYARSPFYDALHWLRRRWRSDESAITGTGFDIVTVVFGRELDLLALQARSFDRFLDPAFTGRIVVVVNDLHCRHVVDLIARNVRPLYCRWARRVTIVPFHELGARLDPSNGWVMQQALKLASARLISQPSYVVFDAKNHLVAATSMSRFVDPDGRAIQALGPGDAHMPKHHETCAAYFGLDPKDGRSRQFVPMTPFVLHTQSVRDLIRHIETHDGESLSSFFRGRRFLSEFMLYGAYLETRGGGIASLYRDAPAKIVTIWPQDDIAEAIARAEESEAFCFGVHREYLARLDRWGAIMLERYWRRVGLLDEDETLLTLSGRS